MRNGNHYVPVRMTPEEKARFIGIAKQCNAPEKTVLYWLMNNMTVRENPPEQFWELQHLLGRLTVNADCIWLQRNLPEKYIQKYYDLGRRINIHDCNITFKCVYADPDYGNDRAN